MSSFSVEKLVEVNCYQPMAHNTGDVFEMVKNHPNDKSYARVSFYFGFVLFCFVVFQNRSLQVFLAILKLLLKDQAGLKLRPACLRLPPPPKTRNKGMHYLAWLHSHRFLRMTASLLRPSRAVQHKLVSPAESPMSPPQRLPLADPSASRFPVFQGHTEQRQYINTGNQHPADTFPSQGAHLLWLFKDQHAFFLSHVLKP